MMGCCYSAKRPKTTEKGSPNSSQIFAEDYEEETSLELKDQSPDKMRVDPKKSNEQQKVDTNEPDDQLSDVQETNGPYPWKRTDSDTYTFPHEQLAQQDAHFAILLTDPKQCNISLTSENNIAISFAITNDEPGNLQMNSIAKEDVVFPFRNVTDDGDYVVLRRNVFYQNRNLALLSADIHAWNVRMKSSKAYAVVDQTPSAESRQAKSAVSQSLKSEDAGEKASESNRPVSKDFLSYLLQEKPSDGAVEPARKRESQNDDGKNQPQENETAPVSSTSSSSNKNRKSNQQSVSGAKPTATQDSRKELSSSTDDNDRTADKRAITGKLGDKNNRNKLTEQPQENETATVSSTSSSSNKNRNRKSNQDSVSGAKPTATQDSRKELSSSTDGNDRTADKKEKTGNHGDKINRNKLTELISDASVIHMADIDVPVPDGPEKPEKSSSTPLASTLKLILVRPNIGKSVNSAKGAKTGGSELVASDSDKPKGPLLRKLRRKVEKVKRLQSRNSQEVSQKRISNAEKVLDLYGRVISSDPKTTEDANYLLGTIIVDTSKCEAFRNLDKERVVAVLRDVRPSVKRQTNVFRAACNWLKTDLDDRMKYAPSVLDCPNYAQMTDDELIQCHIYGCQTGLAEYNPSLSSEGFKRLRKTSESH